MEKRLIGITLIAILVLFYSCSTTQKISPPEEREEVEQTLQEVIQEDKDHAEEQTIQELVEADEVQVEEQVFEVVEEVEMEAPPEPAPSGRIVLVESDLRKEFPKAQHISIGRQMGIDIEDIYYYNNRSQVLAIFVNTVQVETERTLKGIQSKIHDLFWDFNRSNMSTFFQTGGQLYAISSSKREYGETHTIIYDYAELSSEVSKTITAVAETENYPFAEDRIFGIFMRPMYLWNHERSDLSTMTLYYIVEEEDGSMKQYSATAGRGVYMGNPIPLYPDGEGYIHNYKHGNTIKIDRNDNLLSHGNDIPFKEKYNDFLLKVD